MAEYQIVQLTGDGRCRWIHADSDGQRKSEVGSGALGDAAVAAGDREAIVLLPSEDVLTVTTELTVGGKKLMNALPYALEDQLADDVETLHFAPGKRLPNGLLPVAVIARAKMDDHLQALDMAGLRPRRIVPGYHGLAAVPNTLSMLFDGDDVMVNDGRGLMFSLPGARPSDIVAIAKSGDEDDALAAVQVYCDEDTRTSLQTEWALLEQEFDEVDIRVFPDGALPRLAVAVAGGEGVNLLQGDYGEKTSYEQAFQPWRGAAALVATSLLLVFASKVADYVRLGQEESALQAQFTEQYRSIRPNDAREVMDPLGTLNSLRRSLGGGSSGGSLFLPGMQELAKALAGSEVRLEAVSYRAGVMDVRLIAPNVTALDRLQQSVNESTQFSASIQSTTQSGDGINGRVQIRENGA